MAGRRDYSEYVDAICSEIRLRGDGRRLRTIYFGGGTPSLLSPLQLRKITGTIAECFDVSGIEEVTLEANPENLTPEYVALLAEMRFFNRLSIGIQSFSDSELHLLNRVHNANQATDAIHNASEAGFNNISVDLIFGLPHQSVGKWLDKLDILASHKDFGSIKHLSCYELTLEPGSILERQLQMGRLSMAGDEVLEAQYSQLLDWCMRNGFEQYEISNFCRPGFHSRHNSRYWNRTPYIGVGAGAHSFNGTRRRWNKPDIAAYVKGASIGEIPFDEELLSDKDAFNEYIMTSLRTVRGIHKPVIDSEFSSFSTGLAKQIQSFIRKGMIVETKDYYIPTAAGLLHADGIASELFVI